MRNTNVLELASYSQVHGGLSSSSLLRSQSFFNLSFRKRSAAPHVSGYLQSIFTCCTRGFKAGATLRIAFAFERKCKAALDMKGKEMKYQPI